MEKLFGIAQTELSVALKQLHSTVEPIPSTLMALCPLKAQLGMKLILVANASSPTWSHLKSLPSILAVFDAYFVSYCLGVRKPVLLSYDKILAQINIPAQNILYLDTSPEGIAAARSFGITGTLFKSRKDLLHYIENVVVDPVEKGLAYLRQHEKSLYSECRGLLGTQIIKENFAQLLILEATNDPSLVTYKTFNGLWNFFQESQTITTLIFPNDMDTTSVAMTLLSEYGPPKLANKPLEFSFSNQNIDKLPMIYEDKQRPRVDMVACVHIFTMFFVNGRASEVQPSGEYIC